MKTEISSFCKEFGEVLSPINQTLQETLQDIRNKPESQALRVPLSGLTDVQHRLKSLVDKVEQQQAYVIIFGPLKSGKSTLMNGISSAYVSEVTSLPAYPCLVYVRHSEEKKYRFTRYNDRQEASTDSGYVQRMVRDAHQMLAERIRQVEEQGESFDPGIHFPEAIRRFDVELPAKNLKDSLTVLVDTPGLYSKMKFGYDLMTREFRNSAACAIFVVKTDNLFLEQVFAEFNELLDLFSRIFLVVNIDSNKQDLGPDGVLRPSLESENPDKVIRAFESLAMSAPLRKAADEGRLRIYPIDLLNAAAYSLREDGQEAVPEKGGASEELEPPESEEEAESEGGSEQEDGMESGAAAATRKSDVQESFSEFLTDLTDYLNSSDYLVEFIGDSLRQGKTLTEDIERHCSAEALRDFFRESETLEETIRNEKERLAAVEMLEALDWNKTFENLRNKNRQQAYAFSMKLREDLESSLKEMIERWFDSDESLRDLQEEHFNVTLTRQEQAIAEDGASRLRNLTDPSAGSLQLDTETLRAMDRSELSPESLLKECGDIVLESPKKPASCAIHLAVEKLPVKKSVWDWLLFRTQPVMRRRIFGSSEDPSTPIPAAVKQKRLGEAGRDALNSILETHLDKLFPDMPGGYADRLVSECRRLFEERVRERIATIRQELEQRLPDLERQLSANGEVRELLERLKGASAEIRHSIDDLKERHVTAVAVSIGDENPEGEPEDESEGLSSTWDSEEDYRGRE